MHHLRHDRPSISDPYAHKCSHGHMYLVLDTFIRTKSPARLSCRWSRIVRQLSDAPPQARSTVDLHPYAQKCSHGHMYLVLDTFIRAESPARLSGRWSRIVRQLSDAPPSESSPAKHVDLQSPLHTHKNVPTDTCTLCSTPSSGRNRPLG